MSEQKRRMITFPPKAQEHQKHRTLAVAWVTARAGGFESSNVTATIQRELAAEGYRVPQELVKASMVYLCERGYAERVLNGRRHVMFVLDSDVDVPEPPFVTARREMAAATATAPAMAQNGSAPVPVRRPPLPAPPGQPTWLAAVSAALVAWWGEDPAAANKWAGELLETLL